MKHFILTILVFFVSLQVISQTVVMKISGSINDNNGVPLTSVNVFVNETTKKTTTNFDGNFSLKVEQGDILKIRSVGFKTAEIDIDN